MSLYQQKLTKNYQMFLAKYLKDQFIGMNIKQKVRIIIREISIDIFTNQTLQDLADYLLWFIQNMMKMPKSIKFEGIITYQKVFLRIIIIRIINGKKFYDQPIDCDIKGYEEIRKLTTSQVED